MIAPERRRPGMDTEAAEGEDLAQSLLAMLVRSADRVGYTGPDDPRWRAAEPVPTVDRSAVMAPINAMCLDLRASIRDLGLRLRPLDDRHVQRSDDGMCDSCGTRWPCCWRLFVDIHVWIAINAYPELAEQRRWG